MSEDGVYEDEMLNRFSDQDVERLLSGQVPETEELAELAPILEALHAHRASPSEERVARFAAKAAEIATSTRRGRAGPAAPERTTTRSRRFVLALKKKMATGLAAMLLLSGLTGVAAASNHAAPGDALYGLDRALEAVGVGDGGAAERIAEAQALFNDGQVADAIAHAAEAAVTVESEFEIQLEHEPSNASEALTEAANNVRTGGDGDDESEAVRNAVADMLEAMAAILAAEEFDGQAFGDAVATMARGIGGEDDNGGVGLSTADENAPDEADEGLDNAEGADDQAGAADNGDEAKGSADDGLDTADDNTGSAPSSRP